VYNNKQTVEKAIISAFNPSYDTIIIDNFSTDGTYEKLLELKKEYNLKLFRLSCSRGAGKNYALTKCPEGSRTAYIDFDVVYNQNFHKLMLINEDKLLTCTDQYTFYIKRENALKSGGWRNLNTGEVEDFLLRTGINATVPVIIGINQKITSKNREKRYDTVNFQIRNLKNIADWIRGAGLNFSDIKENMNISKSEAIMSYLIAILKGRYKYDEKFTNFALLAIKRLSTLTDPKVFGVSDTYILFHYYPPKGTNLVQDVDDKVKQVWKEGYKFKIWNSLLKDYMLIYVKNKKAIDILPKLSISAVFNGKPIFLKRLTK
jgi:glycosyltransferase involved in cell wall biosynthesis